MRDKIMTILTLLCQVIFRRRHYRLCFYAKPIGPVKVWYYDWNRQHKHSVWPFGEGALMMVCGADELCEYYKKPDDPLHTDVDIIASRSCPNVTLKDYDLYKRETLANGLYERILCGAYYNKLQSEDDKDGKRFWICPVTLFVLGRYPRFIAIKRGTESHS